MDWNQPVMIPMNKEHREPASTDAGKEVPIEPGQNGGGRNPRAVGRQYEEFSNGRISAHYLRCALAQIRWPATRFSSLRSAVGPPFSFLPYLSFPFPVHPV